MTDIGDKSRQTGARAQRRRPTREPAPAQLYAALDLGTNSCRMLIAQPKGAHFDIVDAFSKSVRLGLDLERTGALSDSGISRTLQALHVCSRKLRNLGVKRSRLVATEACRRASNGAAFMERIRRETGLRMEIIRPEEEARLAVISCAPLVSPDARQVLVIDIGGGSTELVWIDLSDVESTTRIKAMIGLKPGQQAQALLQARGARVIDWISIPLGVATLLQRYADVEDDSARFALMSCYFEEQMDAFSPYSSGTNVQWLDGLQMIGTSGTVTTVGAMHLGLRRYDRQKVDGMSMAAGDVDVVIRKFLDLGPEGRRNEPGIGRDRAELIMSGAAILQTILRIWPAQNIRVADRGLREGILFSLMSADGVLNEGHPLV